MHIDLILLIILFRYLQTDNQTKTNFPKWKRYFFYGILLSLLLLIFGSIFTGIRPLITWIAHISIFSLIYFSYQREELLPLKSLVNAILPIAIVNVLEDIVHLIGDDFYDNIDGLLGTAKGFAIVWLVAMFIINRRQRKALAAEQLKAAEKEKEYQRTQELKAELERQVSERTLELTEQKQSLLNTLNELKSTQTQLIQSEKMASLGELTAGIAHEIQNPLNFVNNFSEVSHELIDEMYSELDQGDISEAKAIAEDIKRNLEKINHHGKRADAIVKGMLLHSRNRSGIKELTNINDLADEYLRLSYHGLRAKDKKFNSDFQTNFDPDIPLLNVVPQDVGRVFLNLVNNAFYAVNERKASGEEGYEPTVNINTKKLENSVEIKVRDNGFGIPEEVLDKIFQPFFTTKPTGEGTGLGLSMSYDIITKGHGGQIKVTSKTGKGLPSSEAVTEFTIVLPIND